jgi:hypothetical protein
MDPRLSVALPVPPALAHAAVLRWEADHLVENAGAAWADLVDLLRDLSVVVVAFAVGLVVLALLARVPDVSTAATWVLVATLVPQVGWLAVIGFLDLTAAAPGTVVVLVAASVAAVVSLRRAQSRSA